jgi:succinate dehydrogenase/fumarate reductase flavoprotein subunit
MTKTIKTDVFVVGGGGAAARSAIEAHRAGARTIIAVKGRFGLSGLRGTGATGYSSPRYLYFPFEGAPVKADEEREIIYKRIIQAGLGLADRCLARILVDEGLQVKRSLDKWGVIHPPTLPGPDTAALYQDTNWGPAYPGGISAWIAPMPGLANVIRGVKEITVLEHTMVTDLLVQDGMCLGAIGIDEESGEPLLVEAHSTILATGGDAQLFRVNSHPSCVTGDGYAMGYDAGAELMNMEFMQVFPATAYPTFNILVSAIWEVNPKILNTNKEEFIQNYLPKGVTTEECIRLHSKHGPFSTRDIAKYLEISMVKEINSGRSTEHNACYLEVSALKRLPQRIQQWLIYRGIDFTKEYTEISVAHQCSNGGLRIDEYGQTMIPGLYAVGETASGPHGADRLGGGMMAFCQVFGRRAGKHAAAAAKTKSLPTVDKQKAESQMKCISDLIESKGDQKPLELMKRLKKITWENLLVVRSKEGLTQVLEQIGLIRNELMPRLCVETARELAQAVELRNLLQVGEIVTKAALMRTESRGGHYRDDFPQRDDTNWLQVITIKKVDGKAQLSTVKLDKEWKAREDHLGEGWWG